MNKQYLINFAIFIAGAGAGFFVAKKVYEEKYKRLAQEEIDSVKEYYERKANDILKYCEEDVDVTLKIHENQPTPHDFPDETHEEYERKIGAYSKLTRANPAEEAKRNYNLIGMQINALADEEYENDDNLIDEAGTDESVDDENPYVITEVEFSEEFLHHDKISLIYYAEDDTLTGENEEIIPEIDEIVGYDNLDMKNTTLSHPSTIYIRNERMSIDYEVNVDLGSYQEQILGIPAGLSPRQQQEIRMRKRREKNDSLEMKWGVK